MKSGPAGNRPGTMSEVDDVISVTAGYTVVRKKVGDPREIAVETDPRS